MYPDKYILQNDIIKKQLYIGKIESVIVCIYVLNGDCDEQYINGNWKYSNATYSVIHRMCVNPKFQNQGIGALTIAKDVCIPHHVDHVKLTSYVEYNGEY